MSKGSQNETYICVNIQDTLVCLREDTLSYLNQTEYQLFLSLLNSFSSRAKFKGPPNPVTLTFYDSASQYGDFNYLCSAKSITSVN